jgi:integrase
MELVEIRGVTKRRKKPRILTHDEFLKVLSFVREPYRTMVLVAQCLGLRVSEVMALQWGDFNFAELTVRIQRGIVHGRVDTSKTEYSDETLPIDPDLAAVLLRHKATCPATLEGWVFANRETGKPYWQESACADHIKPAAAKAGVEGTIGWHTFRHTYRSWLDAEGTPITMQRELMRHASIQTTLNVYGRPTMSEAKRKANSNVVKMALKSEPEKTCCSPIAPSEEISRLTGSD